MSAREKIAYLRGLIEGQNMNEDPASTKFHEALLGALDSIAEELGDIAESQEDIRDYVEELEEEIMDLHEKVDPEFEESCGCGCEGDDFDEDDDDEEEEYQAITCPGCGKDFFYQPDAYDDDEDLLCPHCGEPFKGKTV